MSVQVCLTHISIPGREDFPGVAISLHAGIPPANHPWLLRAGTAPSTRPTSLRRYFLTKTYHLRLDPSADYAEAAAALAHNPPQASTSLSLPLLSLCSLLQFLLFFAAFSHQVFQMLSSSHISVRFFKLFSFFSCCLCASG